MIQITHPLPSGSRGFMAERWTGDLNLCKCHPGQQLEAQRVAPWDALRLGTTMPIWQSILQIRSPGIPIGDCAHGECRALAPPGQV